MLRRRAALAAGMLLGASVMCVPGAHAASGGTGPGGSHPGHHHHHHGVRGVATSPLNGNGMWIWYVDQSTGGSYRRIARRAHEHHIQVLYVKSSDGSSAWSQFTPQLVSYMHAHGLRVCAWQYIYGIHPIREAHRGAEAVAKGADCLVIDAESQFEGRYGPAQRYMNGLRSRIGHKFPVALASFPYVDYHPGFPYSVFLGRRGAQWNAPQVYWHAIGTSVPVAMLHTFTFNRVYARGIRPLGQTYGDPPTAEVQQFRRYTNAYHFGGRSWWVWQSTPHRIWRALSRTPGGVGNFRFPSASYPTLRLGSSGDLVVWAQEHLRGAGQTAPVNGVFRDATARAVRRFQRAQGLPADGTVGAKTWRRLLKSRPKSVNWARRSRPGKSAPDEPRSATDPAVRYEIPAISTRLPSLP